MRIFAIALLTLGLGCVPGTYWVTASTVVPPAPHVEIVGTAPGTGYVWVDGYWWWNGASYVWVRGHWGVPPTPGWIWVHGGWVADGGSYVWVHGRWAPPGTRPRVRYVHPQRPRVRVRPGTRYRATPRVRVRPSQGRRTTVRVR